jgi:hypothetical protein
MIATGALTHSIDCAGQNVSTPFTDFPRRFVVIAALRGVSDRRGCTDEKKTHEKGPSTET